MIDVLNMPVEDHARKQIQMHVIVQKLSKMFNDAIPPEFGETFSYLKVFFTTLGNLPVTAWLGREI